MDIRHSGRIYWKLTVKANVTGARIWLIAWTGELSFAKGRDSEALGRDELNYFSQETSFCLQPGKHVYHELSNIAELLAIVEEKEIDKYLAPPYLLCPSFSGAELKRAFFSHKQCYALKLKLTWEIMLQKGFVLEEFMEERWYRFPSWCGLSSGGGRVAASERAWGRILYSGSPTGDRKSISICQLMIFEDCNYLVTLYITFLCFMIYASHGAAQENASPFMAIDLSLILYHLQCAYHWSLRLPLADNVYLVLPHDCKLLPPMQSSEPLLTFAAFIRWARNYTKNVVWLHCIDYRDLGSALISLITFRFLAIFFVFLIYQHQHGFPREERISVARCVFHRFSPPSWGYSDHQCTRFWTCTWNMEQSAHVEREAGCRDNRSWAIAWGSEEL